MKKYLFTENQIKNVVDMIVNEQFGRRDILDIRGIAELISRMGHDFDTMLQLFYETFRDGGDEEVKKLFKDATDIELENVGQGRYVIKY